MPNNTLISLSMTSIFLFYGFLYFGYVYIKYPKNVFVLKLRKLNNCFKFFTTSKKIYILTRPLNKNKPKIPLEELVKIVARIKSDHENKILEHEKRVYESALKFYQCKFNRLEKWKEDPRQIEAFLLESSIYIQKEFNCNKIHTKYLEYKNKKR